MGIGAQTGGAGRLTAFNALPARQRLHLADARDAARAAALDARQPIPAPMLQRSSKPREIQMRYVLAFGVAALLSTGAFAGSDKEHAAHHPAGAASAPAPASKAPTPTQVEQQTRSLREMHERMMAARTPEERQALMAEHMKAMQDGMAMMGQMRGEGGEGAGGRAGGMSTCARMMGPRMDMMEMMMQMMMDREGTTPAGR
jgi:hypothetical protein